MRNRLELSISNPQENELLTKDILFFFLKFNLNVTAVIGSKSITIDLPEQYNPNDFVPAVSDFLRSYSISVINHTALDLKS